MFSAPQQLSSFLFFTSIRLSIFSFSIDLPTHASLHPSIARCSCQLHICQSSDLLTNPWLHSSLRCPLIHSIVCLPIYLRTFQPTHPIISPLGSSSRLSTSSRRLNKRGELVLTARPAVPFWFRCVKLRDDTFSDNIFLLHLSCN